MNEKKKRILRGNETRIDPKTYVEGLYLTNPVTNDITSTTRHLPPVLDPQSATMQRDFSIENKK